MNFRIRAARFLLKLGDFLQSLPVVVMRPDDLVEFSRQHYTGSGLAGWGEEALVDAGLWEEELDLLKDLPATTGELLLLGVGGGREAIPLARMGFQVTGVDYVPAMLACAQENAARRGLRLQGLVQEISRLEAPANAYDVVWLSSAAYSFVPTRARRVEMVRRIARALKPGGVFLFQFHRDLRLQAPRKIRALRRLMAVCTLGNLAYQEGDLLWGNVEFLHAFPDEQAVRAELEEGGLSVVRFQTDLNPVRWGAVCRKSPAAGEKKQDGKENAA